MLLVLSVSWGPVLICSWGITPFFSGCLEAAAVLPSFSSSLRPCKVLFLRAYCTRNHSIRCTPWCEMIATDGGS